MCKFRVIIILILLVSLPYSNSSSLEIMNTTVYTFSPLREGETLAFFRQNRDTTHIYAISRDEKTSRFLFEFTNIFHQWPLFRNNGESCFIMTQIREDRNRSVHLYFIDGNNGNITHLFISEMPFIDVSNDGRFVSGPIRNHETNDILVFLYCVEKKAIVQTFDLDFFPRTISYGTSNFRVYGGGWGWGSASVEAEINTDELILNLIRDHRNDGEYFFSEIFVNSRFVPSDNSVLLLLNNIYNLGVQPRLIRDLGITKPTFVSDSDVSFPIYLVSEELKLFSEPDFSSDVIKTMWRGQEVSILEIGDEVTIDGITSNWVKVRLWRSTTFEISPIGIVGWCFGGFLGLGL